MEAPRFGFAEFYEKLGRSLPESPPYEARRGFGDRGPFCGFRLIAQRNRSPAAVVCKNEVLTNEATIFAKF